MVCRWGCRFQVIIETVYSLFVICSTSRRSGEMRRAQKEPSALDVLPQIPCRMILLAIIIMAVIIIISIIMNVVLIVNIAILVIT